jgi:hypothetical protein
MKKITFGFALATAIFSGASLFAGVTSGAGNWEGKGVTFGQDGAASGKFSLGIVSEAQDSHTLKSTVTILADGQASTYQQVMKDAGDQGFQIVSDQGNGGGYCFGQGICEGYLGTTAHGYAVSIVLDGPDHRRMLVTELVNGNAVKFVRESLDRVE